MSARRARVLVVEDEPVLALALEDMLTDLDFDVVGPAFHLDTALKLARTASLDAAVLDINLAGERSYPVADVLKRRGIPYLFATGYGALRAAAHADSVLVAKPYRLADIAAALDALLAERAQR